NLKEEIAIPGGETLAVLISLRASSRRDHEAGVIEGALIDITELERIKDLVKRSRHRFRQLYDATPVMLYSLDDRGCIQDINDHMLERLGRERHDLIGCDGAELMPQDARAETTRKLARTLRRGERATLDCEIIDSDGRPIHGRLVASPKLDKDGMYGGAFVCILDMSDVVAATAERDRIAEELQTAQKLEAVGQLAAGIAHEINTPAQYVADNLQFVSQAVGQMLDYVAADADVDEAAAEIDVEFLRAEVPNALTEAADGMQQIKRIVLAMKDFSHPGGDEHEPVDVNRLIESVATVTRNEWKYVAKLTTALAPDLPPLVCSGSALNQVLLNMVVNASHALEGAEDGEIRIGTAVVDGHIRITIEDNGCGIDADVLSKIFNPFFTTKDVGKGTGQGLAIAYRIVSEHHGRIDVDSNVGEGTTFTISLPLSVPDESTEDAA
ncbi:MAG: ATP-binding protein, partial [Pseudomonadota bacterium]